MKKLQITAYRDFGKTIEDSLKFFFKNWKRILSLYLVFAMPFYILSVVLYSVYTSELNRMFEIGGEEFQINLSSIFSGLAGLLSFIAFSLAIYAYTAWQAEEEQKEFPDLENWWQGTIDRMRLQSWPYIGAILIYFVSLLLIMAFPIGLIAMGYIGWGGFLMFVLLFVMIYYSVAFSYVQYSAVENTARTIWDHFRYGFELVKGYWWETLGLLIVMGLIRMVLTLILSIPFMLLSLVSYFGTDSEGFGGFDGMAYTWGSSALGSLFYVIVLIAIVFKYYSIIERKEGVSLQERIDQFEENDQNNNFENEGEF